MPRSTPFSQRVDAVRDFNRFYVPRMGFLDRGWTNMMSLTEARIIHEIYIRPSITASEIIKIIAIDGGYLSRVLRKFESNGYILRKKIPRDGRQRVLSLTAKGRRAYDAWSVIARENVAHAIRHLDEAHQVEILQAMQRIRALIEAGDARLKQSDHRLITPGL